MADISQVEAALAQLSSAETIISVGTRPGVEDLPPVKFHRLGVTRRVLGHITDEVEFSALGPRNTLAALIYSIMRDRNTTNAPEPNESLDDKKSIGEIATEVLEHIEKLKDAGLVAEREDEDGLHYVVTPAGHAELRS